MVAQEIAAFDELGYVKRLGYGPVKFTGMTNVWGGKRGTYYYPKTNKWKNKLVLHYLAGSFQGGLPWLTRSNYRVSVAFIIGRSGLIVNPFNPDYWSYHIGKNSFVSNEKISFESVGVEIASWGFLVRRGDYLYTYTGQKYCSLQDAHAYVKTESWRGFEYWDTYTEAQYKSLKFLTDYLCNRYPIPRKFLYDEVGLETTSRVASFKGIMTHTHARFDKWDVGPSFNWDQIR
jgi:N-acetylmuramoyl-L-alanine amidase